MVLSCLVEPLVSPLIGRGAGGPGRKSGFRRSRLGATALAASALLVCAQGLPSADDLLKEKNEERVVCNAHAKPAPIPSRVQLAELLAVREDEAPELAAPVEAPEFEWDAVFAHRLKHSRDIVRDTGPGLGLGLRIDRTRGAVSRTFCLFASGQHRSGAPNPALT